jgi:pilus assembly protein CpaD
MMSPRHPSLLALFASACLAACSPTASYWSDIQSSKQNQVESVRLTHDLRVPASGNLSSTETRELDDFLARHEVNFGDSVILLASAGRSAAPAADYLRKQGIAAGQASAGAAEAPAGAVRVVVQRYVVVPPNCPDWSKPATNDYTNVTMSNFGCANTSNLGQMLANPHDLIQGRASGSADGTVSAAATQRYRAGKVMPLPKESTTE